MLRQLEELVDEVRLSFHAFSEFARRAHGDRIDPPGRAVLEYLSRNPPATVPTMARSRGVTRQHIQTIVSALESDGLVEATPNPAHKRSHLFALTGAGEALIDSVTKSERALIEPLGDALETDRLIVAAETLRQVRTLLTALEHTS